MELRIGIEESRERHAQIGMPATYLDQVDSWANGGDCLNAESLEGEVVLLDFFAVWCGLCIRTFPDLRRWHEKYAGEGLHIIGVSEYHRYGWDSELGRATKVPDIEPDAERKAMAQFNTKYELPYTVAFVADK